MTVFHNLAYGDITLKRAISRPQRIVFLENKEKGLYVGRPRVTSLEQLSVAEFSGEETRSKVYENGHKRF